MDCNGGKEEKAGQVRWNMHFVETDSTNGLESLMRNERGKIKAFKAPLFKVLDTPHRRTA